MKTRNCFLVFLSLIIFSLFLISCNTVYYGVGNVHNKSKYLQKPLYNDSVSKATYISGSFSNNLGRGYYKGEDSYYGDITFHQAYNKKYFVWAYGLSGFYGTYNVKELYEYPGYKTFYGGAITGDIALNIPIISDNSQFEYRILGLRLSLLYEDGAFADFRKNAKSEYLIVNSNPLNTSLNVTYYSDFAVKFDEDRTFGISGGFGHTIGRAFNQRLDYLFPTGSVYSTIFNYFVELQLMYYWEAGGAVTMVFGYKF